MSDTNNGPSGSLPPPDFQKGLIPLAPSSLQPRHPRPGLHRSAESQQGITLQFVLTAVRQWWKVATPIGLVLAAISWTLILFLFSKPEYKATAWLQIQETRPYIAFQPSGTSKTFVNTQVQLVQSPLVIGPKLLQEKIKRWDGNAWIDADETISSLPGIQEEIRKQRDPIRWLAQGVVAGPVGRSQYFNISFQSYDAQDATDIVNTVTYAYLDAQRQREDREVDDLVDRLKKERDRRANTVSRLRENVRAFTKEATGTDPFAPPGAPNASFSVAHPLALVQTALINMEFDRVVLEQRIANVRKSISEQAAEVPEAVVEDALEQHAGVQALKRTLLAKQSQLQEVESKLVKGKNRDLVCQRFQEEINTDEDILEKLRKEVRQQVVTDLINKRKSQLAGSLAEMLSELDDRRIKQKLAQERYNRELEKVKELRGETLELVFARDELERGQGVLDRIENRITALLTERRAPARVLLVQAATVPTVPVESRLWTKIILAVLASLCLPFGLAVLWERLVRRVTDVGQLEEHSNLTVVGEVARLPVRTTVLRGRSSKRVGRSLGIFEESIDSLRTCLILSEPLRDMKVLAVTSSTNREGKTSVAVQLAVSIARASGEPTLLIDGDMRSPDIHNVLDIPLQPGLGDVLAGQCSLKDAIVSDSNEGVHLLPAGRLHASPHKLLGNGVLGPLFEEVRGLYRYVVVDTPPVLAAGEALVLARAADASLLCAMRDVSRVDQIKKTHERLLTAGARPVGIVLNGIPAKRYTYRYGSYAYSQE